MSRDPGSGEAGGVPGRGWEAVFDPDFREDLLYFVEKNPRLAKRVLELVEAVLRDPFSGPGKPEPLRGAGPDRWSRRVTEEHRLVYRIGNRRVYFLQARYHY